MGIEMAKRINDDLAVYTAELVAIWLALLWLESNNCLQAVIASDSSSAMYSIQNYRSDSREDILVEILQLANGIQASGRRVTFVWVPAHIGVEGNEMADEHAKRVTDKSNIDIDVKYSKAEIKSIIKAKTIKKWQHIWDNGCSGRHLYRIQGKVGKETHITRSRQEEIVLTRMRLGHTKLNSTMFLIKKHVDGNCEYCQSNIPETVEHVIMYCQKYNEARQRLVNELKAKKMSLETKTLLDRSSRENFDLLFSFLKSTGLLKRI